MAKIHTHYDNLKVARKAPQEVIRAAYKALSQKYHPDKNQGDEQAARIMAIVNTAYGILGEPARRQEHDAWIAAEEWNIAWRESTGAADGHPRPAPEAAREAPLEAPAWRLARDARWWGALAASFAAGCAASLLLIDQPPVLPAALASARHLAAEPAPRFEPDVLAAGRAASPDAGARAPGIKVLAVTGLVVPARAGDCAAELHTLVAPNGEPWPIASGYVDGYPVDNPGEEMQIRIDNTANPAAVYVKLYDLERRAYARHAYVLAHGALAIDQLASGKYEVRYQNVAPDGSMAQCAARRANAPKQAAVVP